MNRFTLFGRRHARKRRAAVRLELELLESRTLPSTIPPLSGVLELAQAGKITAADFKNPPSPIGTNPYSTDYNVNTDTPGEAGNAPTPHNETTIAVNPTNPLNLIACANDYQAILQNNGFFTTAFMRAHVTFDGGHTWTEYPVPFQGYDYTGDPAVSFDADGTAYLNSLGFVVAQNGAFNRGNIDILVAHSADGGQTWSHPAVVAAGVGASGSNGQKTINDKPYLTAWGHGNAIETWTQTDLPGQPPSFLPDLVIEASVTHDGGKTWTDPVPISNSGFYTLNFNSVPTVAADGSIYVAYESLNNEVAPDYRPSYLVVRVDPATGQPLGAPVEVNLVYAGIFDYPRNVYFQATYHDSEFRTNSAGNITADPTNAQHLAVVWSDMRNSARLASFPSDPYLVQTNSDIIISQSFDGGQTWSSPTAIKAAGDQFMPWGAYNSSGLLQIGYFDRSYDPANHQYGYTLASEKKDGSLKFTFQQVTTALSDPTQGDSLPFTITANPNFPNATTFLGDYSGIAAVSPTLVAALWTDMREQSILGGSAEDAYFALVDPPAGGSALTAPALISATAAVTEPGALLSGEASWKGLAVDAYFMNLARTSQEASNVTNGDTVPRSSFSLAPLSLAAGTDQVVTLPFRVSDTSSPALVRRAAHGPADDWAKDILTSADLSWDGEAVSQLAR